MNEYTDPPAKSISEQSSRLDSKCAEHPLVSVVVCTRGFCPSLARCLDALAAQGCTRCEILVVLNREMDMSFAHELSRFPVRVLAEPRRGVCVARNHALRHALGGILAFVDDDVVGHPNWLHELVKGFEDPSVACVTGRVVPEKAMPFQIEKARRYYTSPRVFSEWTLNPSDPKAYEKILTDPVGFGCNMAFRKSFLQSHAPFPEDLGAGSPISGGDEFYMFLQVIKHGFRLRHVPTAVVTHTFEDNAEKAKLRMRELYAGSIAFTLKLLVDGKGYRLATLKFIWAAARKRLRRLGRRKTLASESQELLTPSEKLFAYLRGPFVFLRSRRARKTSTFCS